MNNYIDKLSDDACYNIEQIASLLKQISQDSCDALPFQSTRALVASELLGYVIKDVRKLQSIAKELN